MRLSEQSAQLWLGCAVCPLARICVSRPHLNLAECQWHFEIPHCWKMMCARKLKISHQFLWKRTNTCPAAHDHRMVAWLIWSCVPLALRDLMSSSLDLVVCANGTPWFNHIPNNISSCDLVVRAIGTHLRFHPIITSTWLGVNGINMWPNRTWSSHGGMTRICCVPLALQDWMSLLATHYDQVTWFVRAIGTFVALYPRSGGN